MANDLLFAMVAATAQSVPDRARGARHMIVAWAKLGGGNEQQAIIDELKARGWKVDDVRQTKQVSSTEKVDADNPVGPALIEAREKGFAFLVYSQPPK